MLVFLLISSASIVVIVGYSGDGVDTEEDACICLFFSDTADTAAVT
jgi:hypothetical protein